MNTQRNQTVDRLSLYTQQAAYDMLEEPERVNEAIKLLGKTRINTFNDQVGVYFHGCVDTSTLYN